MLLIGSHVSFEKEQLLVVLNKSYLMVVIHLCFYTGPPQNTIRRTIMII